MSHRGRRQFLIGSGALFAAQLAHAQVPATVRRIGWLNPGSPASHGAFLEGFREGMREHGWAEGRTFALEQRWAEGRLERLPSLAAELVALKPEVVVTAANVAHLAMRKLTSTIPIVMATGADPVVAGLAKSFARPNGNVTGLSGLYDELPAKLLENAAALLPSGARATVLIDRNVPFLRGASRGVLENAAKAVRLRAEFVELGESNDIARVLSADRKPPPMAYIAMPSPMFFAMREDLVKRAGAVKTPLISVFEEITDLGGVMSYSVNVRASYRRAAWYVDRILRGAKPGELPIEQPKEISLILNLRVAKALGITVPQSLLVRADRVIE